MARSLKHKVKAIIIFGEINRNYYVAVRLFSERFFDRLIRRKYF